MLIALLVVVIGAILSPIFAVLSLVVLITGIVGGCTCVVGIER